MKEPFCPKCGKKGEGIGKKNLCKDCWREENDLAEIPDEVEIEVCPYCGFMKKRGRWVEIKNDAEKISKALDKFLDDCEAEAEFEEKEDALKVTVKCKKDINGKKLEQDIETEIKEENEPCPSCSRRISGYFETIIQLRGEKADKGIEKIRSSSREMQDRQNYISKVEKVKDGYDIYLSSNKITENILKVLRDNYSLETKRSYEQIGEKEGKKMYRNYVSARIKEE